MGKIMTSIVIYGEIDDKTESWKRWVDFSKDIVSRYSSNTAYISIKADGFNNNNVVKYDIIMQKISQAIIDEKSFEYISMYSLPDNFEQAAFDYDIYISRVKSKRASYAFVTISKDIVMSEKVNINELKESLLEFVHKENGIAFEMDVNEFPPKYIMSKGTNTNFQSLNIIEKF